VGQTGENDPGGAGKIYGLPESTVQKIQAVFNGYPQVGQAIRYGSRAKGSCRKGSDIDLTLRGSNELTQTVRYKILEDIDDLLLPYTLDLSIFRDLEDPAIIEHIQRVGLSFYDKPEVITKSAAP
jgi:uncharacterized protein